MKHYIPVIKKISRGCDWEQVQNEIYNYTQLKITINYNFLKKLKIYKSNNANNAIYKA